MDPDGIPQKTETWPDVPNPRIALFARTIPVRKLIVLARGIDDPAGKTVR